MIFLMQLEINKHFYIFQVLQIALELRALKLTFTCVYLFQIALKIMCQLLQIVYLGQGLNVSHGPMRTDKIMSTSQLLL